LEDKKELTMNVNAFFFSKKAFCLNEPLSIDNTASKVKGRMKEV